ncbi:hypothetical protein [Acinetobacter soli]|uniref:hypothetical protein n=1 Tax=Acinetobacter soli TaxID=487316 RepID=UPI0006E42890|nr:hypothetical protein [Acinetobacter soli]
MHRILPNLRQELARGSWAFKMHRILPNLRQELARGSWAFKMHCILPNYYFKVIFTSLVN